MSIFANFENLAHFLYLQKHCCQFFGSKGISGSLISIKDIHRDPTNASYKLCGLIKKELKTEKMLALGKKTFDASERF